MYVNRTFLPTVCFNYIIVNNSQDVQNIYVHVAYVFISLPQIILMMYTVQYSILYCTDVHIYQYFHYTTVFFLLYIISLSLYLGFEIGKKKYLFVVN